MKKLLGIFCLLMLWGNPSNSFEVGQNVYLNACGSSPTEYFNSPLKIHNILFEAPNKIIKLEESKYEREFQTLATSTINFANKQITINLSNFRDVVITDEKEIVLEERKVSGATSIYEIKHQGEVVAWGVGWHQHCKEGYAHVDFTAFRLFVPYLDNGEIKIQNKLIQLKINQVKEALIEGDSLILADGINISGSDGASTYYYHGASFFEIDNKNGINFDLSFEELNKKIDINKLNPALILSTLTNYNQLEKLEEYSKKNFDIIYQDLNDNYWWSMWDGYLQGDGQPGIQRVFLDTLAKLSINEEKKNELYKISSSKIPEREIQLVKENCLKNSSYEDVFDLIANCYPYHSAWMFNSITTDLETSGFLDEYSKNPKLYCSQIKEDGKFGDIQTLDLNIVAYKNLEISDSFIKFNWESGKYFISSVLDKDTKLLAHDVYIDSERKILEFRQSWHCEDELAKIKKFIQTPKKVEQTPKDKRTVTESKMDVAWKVDNKFIIPECFDYVWLSGDKYETFFNEYIEKLDTHREDPRFQNFIVEIGTYLNREVPLNHSIKTGWGEDFPNEISLLRQLDSCMSDKPETEVKIVNEYGSQSEIRYEVVETYNLEKGKELAPHIKQEFESIKKVDIAEWGGGSMGHTYHTVTYGLLTIEGKKVLLPLKNHIKY